MASAGVLLDRKPEFLFDLALLGVRESHEHVVVDELVIAERLAGGVQALERLLRIRIGAEGDRDVLQLLQPAPDAGHLFGKDLAAEERVVVVEAGVSASESPPRRSSTTLSKISAQA